MSSGLSDTQRLVLRAVCNTYVPSLKMPDDRDGFWGRSASDLGVERVLTRVIEREVPEPLRLGLLAVLDELATRGFARASQERREALLRAVAGSSPQMGGLISFFEKQTLLLNYGLPENATSDPNLVTYGSPQGQNPNWETMGYPGPTSVPRATDPDVRLPTVVPSGQAFSISADVCIVGSGAGGAVIAAKLSALGRRVVVLEMGHQYTAADFRQIELWSYRHLWFRGGATPSADGNVLLLAGSTLGGGTEINWMNCVRTPELVRQDWAKQYGLDGVDTPAFERYIEHVSTRIMASPQTAYFNSQNLRMHEGCERLGYFNSRNDVNWDPALFNPLMAGYTGLGDQTGGKMTARRTWLRDASAAGARIITHCRANRILVEGGRAIGVEATHLGADGQPTVVTVHAPQVVVAGGALESPSLLLRSGIGGPAVGKYLRVQPGGAVYGVYKERQKGWWGSPMTVNCEQFVDTGGGFGFYMEIPAFGPGFVASVIPWSSGRQHKEVVTKVPYISTFIWFLRDRGHGRVTLDSTGNSIITYQLSDEVDQRNFRQASSEAIRIHAAAGAEEIYFSLRNSQLLWKRGQSLEGFIRTTLRQPLVDGAQPMISAHQLCSCRMGKDPAISVADPYGQLHDTQGVWVGDGSACPTALGANPMVTIMSLAERTADHMATAGERSWAGMPGVPLPTMTNPLALLGLGGRLMAAMGQAGLHLVEAGVKALSGTRPQNVETSPPPRAQLPETIE